MASADFGKEVDSLKLLASTTVTTSDMAMREFRPVPQQHKDQISRRGSRIRRSSSSDSRRSRSIRGSGISRSMRRSSSSSSSGSGSGAVGQWGSGVVV